MIIKIKTKNFLLIIFCLSFLINKTNNFKENKKYWVGETYEISIKEFSHLKNDIIYIKSKKNLVDYNLIDRKITMKAKGRECLTVSTKNLTVYNCFNIYNTPNINFKDDNPIKLEIKANRKLKLNTYNYPKSNIEYKSNNPDIINVNNKGEITALRPGNAFISAIGLDNKTFTIKVISLANNGLINNFTLDNLKANQYENVMIVAHPDDEILWGGGNLYKNNYFIACLTNGYNQIRANEFRKMLNFTKSGGIILNYTDLQDNNICDWSDIKNGIIKDLSTIINYKKWNKIVTHGPEGTTGHLHHRLISNYVSNITKKFNKFNILYYFSKFYKKGHIPNNFGIINKEELEFKKKAIEIYQSQIKGINKLWYHFLPYENWILASKWKNIS